jgi:SH3-like domain-containing protein
MEQREKERVRTPMIWSGSRARPGCEGKHRPGRRFVLGCAVLAAGMVGACRPGEATQGAADAPARRTPSGLPVPRYVSLKFDEVNARGGPGDDYKLLWTYRARNLPLQVIAETSDWRRVCDPDGGLAWVHQRTVDTRRTVMRTQAAPVDLHRRPTAESPVVARLAGRAIASLDSCKDGWCRIAVGKAEGWAPEGEVWGAAEGARCRPLPVVVRR